MTLTQRVLQLRLQWVSPSGRVCMTEGLRLHSMTVERNPASDPFPQRIDGHRARRIQQVTRSPLSLGSDSPSTSPTTWLHLAWPGSRVPATEPGRPDSRGASWDGYTYKSTPHGEMPCARSCGSGTPPSHVTAPGGSDLVLCHNHFFGIGQCSHYRGGDPRTKLPQACHCGSGYP